MTDNSSGIRRVSARRIYLILAVACYVLIFNLTYRDLVAPVFEFWGLGYRPPPSPYFWTSVILCLIPSLWMPLRFSRPSLVLFYVQYFLIFIPASFIVYNSVRPELPQHDSLVLVVTMFAGMSLIQFAYLLPPGRIRSIRVSPEAFWLAFVSASGVMLAYLAVTVGANFRLANFVDIYEVRSAMGEAISATGSRFGLYAQSLLSALVFPLLFATGMYLRRWWVMILVTGGYTFLFGIAGAKAAALAIIYLPFTYLLLSRPPRRIVFYFVATLSLLLLSGYATRVLLPPKAHLEFIAVVHSRFFTIPPLTIPQYFDFFQTHQVTHLSHVTGINWLLRYPYDLDLPYTIGAYIYRASVGLNSGVWAGDGLAGFGLWGIPLVSVFCAVVFWLLDSASAEFDPTFIGLSLTYCTVFFGNVSLFTTLISGGLALLMFTTLIAPRDERGLIRLPSMSFLRRTAYTRP
jgi:hypothetical protein